MFALKMMNLCNKFKALGEGSVHLKNETGVSFGILSQGRSSTKIVGGGGQDLKKCQPLWLADEEKFRF